MSNNRVGTELFDKIVDLFVENLSLDEIAYIKEYYDESDIFDLADIALRKKEKGNEYKTLFSLSA